ncbi:TIGR03086 family metal-binding protein [Jiangella endophytica]|uniref:TIGR03086 family metal-binding protein n=1 Tax=Jiangella endophytica TaxID=1623398 RepID=UPI000E34447E|nr:TIGR03086 family metal-binding protein [Jiangella endophytica]
MTDIADRYRRLAAVLTRRIESVPADRWESPSPCEGWTTRDVVAHLVDWHGELARLGGLSLPAGPSAADDPVAAWRHTRDAMQELLDDPARADTPYEGMFGPTTVAATADRFLGLDLIVHGWDIARGAGLDDAIPAEDVADLLPMVEQLGDNLRRPGVCGPAVPVPDDADDQTRLLGLLGRSR